LLQWLHEEQQCPWSFTAGCLAAHHNQLTVLQYNYSKHDGGVPEPNAERAQRVEFSLSAVESDSAELLQWCHDRQLLCDSTGDKWLYARAIRLTLFRAARWLFQHGFVLHGVQQQDILAQLETPQAQQGMDKLLLAMHRMM
jgi:hypothetical protein